MFGNIKPITPSEALAAKAAEIPDVVYEVVNKLLAQKIRSESGQEIVITQDAIIDGVLTASTDTNLTRDLIFSNHWLDIEEPYRRAGWKVLYDKPAYCEDYKAHFVFSKPR